MDFDIYLVDSVGVKIPKVDRKGKPYDDIVTYTPIIPTALFENVDTGINKVELSYIVNDQVKSVIVNRSQIAQKSQIVKLADNGINVTSESAGELVKYISEFIGKNEQLLPKLNSKSVMGWQGEEFLPYLGDVVFDGDTNFADLRSAVHGTGNKAEWIKKVGEYRRHSIPLRLALDASFASPIIDKVGENSFITHLWGMTGSGKTVALMVAMSVWGDPHKGKLLKTLNMTQNSLMSTAAFLNDLPFAGDEMQTIKSSWSSYDQLIMRVTEGIDRSRMEYDKVKEVKSWNCAFITNGEEPIIKNSSGGGAKNRVIEVEVPDSIVEDGNACAEFVKNNYGLVAEDYLKALLATDLKGLYRSYFQAIITDKSIDTTDKQAGAAALLLMADFISTGAFWPGERPLSIDQITPYLSQKEYVGQSRRAYEFIVDKISENYKNFESEARTFWGTIETANNEDVAYVLSSVLSGLLEDEGYDLKALRRKWIEDGYLIPGYNGKPSTKKHMPGSKEASVTCYALVLPQEEKQLNFNPFTE